MNIVEAAKQGNLDRIKELVKQGVSVNATIDEEGLSALMEASRSGHKAIAEWLVENGAKIDQKENITGRTALICAIQFEKNDIAEFLVKNGADVNLKSKFGATPLLNAIDNPGIVEFLIENGAEVNYVNHGNKERTALIEALRTGVQEVAEILIKYGAGIHFISDTRSTLYYAKEYRKDIDKLFPKEVMNNFDKEGLSILMRSCEAKDEESVFFLIEKGADILAENDHGVSALDILNRKRILPEKLIALREKWTLEKSVTQDEDRTLGL